VGGRLLSYTAKLLRRHEQRISASLDLDGDPVVVVGAREDPAVAPGRRGLSRRRRGGSQDLHEAAGPQSAAGSRFVERLLTVAAACRQQGRPLLDFLVAAGEAALQGSPPPSLPPARVG
jgi:transposase